MKFVDLFLHKGKTYSSKYKKPLIINTYAISQHLSRNSHKYIANLEKKIEQLESEIEVVKNHDEIWKIMAPEEYSKAYSTLPPHHGKVLLEIDNMPESAAIYVYLK